MTTTTLVSQMVVFERYGARLTTDDLAALLRQARGSILNQISAGTFPIPTYVEGGRRFADFRDVAAHLDAQRAQAHQWIDSLRESSCRSNFVAISGEVRRLFGGYLGQLKPRLRPLDGVVYGLRRQASSAGGIRLTGAFDQHHASGVRGLAAAQTQELGEGLELDVSHGCAPAIFPPRGPAASSAGPGRAVARRA